MYIIIIGAGDVGYNLAKQLSRENHDVVLIEQDHDRFKRAAESLDVKAVHGSGTSYGVLEAAAIQSADLLVAVTTSDEVNLIAAIIAKEYNVKKTVARVKNSEFLDPKAPINRQKFKIDLIIHPESVAASAAVRLLQETAFTDVIDFEEGRIKVLGIQLDGRSPIVNKSLVEVAREYSDVIFRIVAIQRKDITRIPTGNDELLPHDRIFLATKREAMSNVIELTGRETTKKIEHIMIIGGGQSGYVLAKRLEEHQKVKLIEENHGKCEELAEKLPSTLVIHGDGRDLNLLALESITDMQAFVALTGDDETNIISCLMAKHLRVPRIIAMINKLTYAPILPTIGIDAYISKQILTVDAILKFIRRGVIVSVASMPGIAAEAIELIPQPGSKITKKPLVDLEFPKNAIVGAVMRSDDVFIPVGDTQIRVGDKVVLFALPSAIRNVEKFFN